MYLILIFLVNFQQTKSTELLMYEAKMQALDSESLRIRFRIGGNDIGSLNGQFSAHHKECPFGNCGSSSYQLPLFPGQSISIEADLSPCTKPLVIEVRSYRKDNVGWYYPKKWDWSNTGRIFITFPIHHHIFLLRQSFLC